MRAQTAPVLPAGANKMSLAVDSASFVLNKPGLIDRVTFMKLMDGMTKWLLRGEKENMSEECGRKYAVSRQLSEREKREREKRRVDRVFRGARAMKSIKGELERE